MPSQSEARENHSMHIEETNRLAASWLAEIAEINIYIFFSHHIKKRKNNHFLFLFVIFNLLQ